MHFSITKGDRLKDLPKDVDLITMGINPSKMELHPGHWLALGQLGLLMHERQRAVGKIFVDDREFDSRKYSNAEVEKKQIIKPPEPVVRTIAGAIHRYVEGLSKELGDPSIAERVNIQPMSQYMAESGLRGETNGFNLYQIAQDHPRVLKDHLDLTDRASHQRTFRPVCDTCDHVTMSHKHVRLNGEGVHGDCVNDDCPVAAYNVNLRQGSNRVMLNYVFDPLRDIDMARQKKGVLHVFGGDYAVPWGPGGVAKAERISEAAKQIAPDITLHHYTGPMLVRNGEKLSKTNGDRGRPLTLEQLLSVLDRAEPQMEFDYHRLPQAAAV